VLVVADGDVEFRHRLERHDALEKTDHIAGHIRLHVEIAAGEAEDDAGIVFAEQRRVDDDAAPRFIAQVEQRQDDGQDAVAFADAPHQVGAFVAIEDRLEHLHCVEVGRIPQTGEVAFHLARHAAGVAVEIVVGHGKAIVEQDRLDHSLQAAHLGVAAQHLHGAGGDGRGAKPDKFQRRVDAHRDQDAPGCRVEEGLRQFHVPALADQGRIGVFDADPQFPLLRVVAQQHLQAGGQAAQHLFAQIEPFAGVGLPLDPFTALEALRRAPGDGLELTVIVVERLVDGCSGFARQRAIGRIDWSHRSYLLHPR
jgi:hypothetical protein